MALVSAGLAEVGVVSADPQPQPSHFPTLHPTSSLTLNLTLHPLHPAPPPPSPTPHQVTAAGLGVDLSCAAQALFAELPPDATWLTQAGRIYGEREREREMQYADTDAMRHSQGPYLD